MTPQHRPGASDTPEDEAMRDGLNLPSRRGGGDDADSGDGSTGRGGTSSRRKAPGGARKTARKTATGSRNLAGSGKSTGRETASKPTGGARRKSR